MEALRIVLTQRSANYRREETVDNKMTYPLPPLSTIIGAMHTICGYHEYNEMDISVQGQFESMHKEPYTDYCFLNTTMDDRGTLVKMKNSSMLSTAYEKVAAAKKSQGNSFRKETTIKVFNAALLKEYQDIKDLGDAIADFKSRRMKPLLDQIKRRKNQLSQKKKSLDKNLESYQRVDQREKEIKNQEKTAKERLKQFETDQYNMPVSKYRSLNTSLKYYEILDNITLMLHVKAERKVLEDIAANIYELKCLGRSEDFVEVLDAEFVELTHDCQDEVESDWSAYLDYKLFLKKYLYTRIKRERKINGTKYYLNKNYTLVDGKRVFKDKIKAIYTSAYTLEEFDDLTDEERSMLWIDEWKNKKYIVNFL